MGAGRETVAGGRIALGRRTAGLAAGDVAAILAFVVLGEISHYSVGFVLANPGYVLGTAAPFLLGWLAVAPVAGLYRERPERPLRAALAGIGVWVVAALVGQALRATALFHGGAAPTFVLVSVVVGGGLIGSWRALAALL